MASIVRLLVCCAIAPSLLGCAMCASTDDCNYAAYGGRWQRSDMAYGRVGSAFGAGYEAVGTWFSGEEVQEEETIPASGFEELTYEDLRDDQEEAVSDGPQLRQDRQVAPATFMAEDDDGRPLFR